MEILVLPVNSGNDGNDIAVLCDPVCRGFSFCFIDFPSSATT